MPNLSVSAAVLARRSVRAFLDTPVAESDLREVLELAARAPSGGNLQPWRIYVLSGERLAELKRLASRSSPTPSEYPIYPEKLGEPYRTSRYQIGEQLYASIGIGRDDKMGRMRQMLKNFDFFGAPVGLFCYVDRQMGAPQWSDLGMYLQTLMLLLQERGIDSCAQEAWATHYKLVDKFLQSPAEQMLFCGMAIGHADTDAAINQIRSERQGLSDFAVFQGF